MTSTKEQIVQIRQSLLSAMDNIDADDLDELNHQIDLHLANAHLAGVQSAHAKMKASSNAHPVMQDAISKHFRAVNDHFDGGA